MKVWSGRPYPLGATWDGERANCALFSDNATSVELCRFVYLPEGRPGLNEDSVAGSYDPATGHRCHPPNLLIDP